MNYWIFVVTGHNTSKGNLSARNILTQRISDRFWGLGEKTPNRRSLAKGDRVVFYVGIPEKVFAATVTLSGSCFELDNSQKGRLGHDNEFYMTDYGVMLEEIDVWGSPKPVEGLVPLLRFIENKEFWYTYFQGGIRQISEEDYRLIVDRVDINIVDQIQRTKDLESQSEFALETHLEEFIASNWNRIDWGTELALYETEEQSGRQFPAGTWSIDFLAVDTNNNDLVVIELKRGQTSDSTVGQILRYINWVNENIAEHNQSVRGIIIGRQIDDALRYAVKGLDHIQVKTYEVDFKLFSVEK